MRKCLDEGILQSYFDGELGSEQMESATLHLAACSNCAETARALEGEINLLSSALAPELDAAVPTERLRHRIDAAVAELPLVNSTAIEQSAAPAARGWLQSLAALFAFTPQQAFGYAGLAVVLTFAAVFGIIKWRQAPSPIADNVAAKTEPVTKTAPGNEDTVATVPPAPSTVGPAPGKTSTSTQRTRPVRSRAAGTDQTVAQVQLLPGERSYLKNIAALDSTIKANSNRPMRPSLQAEYERNLAVVNRALAATRSAAKKNPNDPDAAEFMFAAYQSKLDLLNTVADARVYNRQQ